MCIVHRLLYHIAHIAHIARTRGRVDVHIAHIARIARTWGTVRVRRLGACLAYWRHLPGIGALPSPRQGRDSSYRGRISDFGFLPRSDFRLRFLPEKTHHRASAEGRCRPRSIADRVFFSPFTRPSVNPGVGTGMLHSILLWQQDCFNHSCADSRIAPVHYKQLGLGTVLARAQACDGVELPGLRHVVDADDEGQATREECVSQLRVKDQVVAPSRTIVVHAAAGENVRRVSVGALVRQAGQSA